MSKLPMVSIIIPIFNVEKYIHECIGSIVGQTYNNLEIILVNDGSSDNSGVIADEYAKKDSRVRVIHKQNEGVSIAKNVGLKQAKGQFITFIDADDYIREDFVENLTSEMLRSSMLIATTPTARSLDEGVFEESEICRRSEALDRMFYGTLEKSDNGIQMYSRQLLVDHGILFDRSKKVGEDFDFLVQALLQCEGLVVDYRKMYFYRPNPSSTMNQSINEDLMKAVLNFSLIGEKLIKKYPTLRRAVDAKKFTDSVSLSIRGYHVRSEWHEDFKDLEYNIESLRWQILRDSKARTMVRLAAFAYCLFGYHIGTIILRGLKK